LTDYNPVPYGLKEIKDICAPDKFFGVGSRIPLETYHELIAQYQLDDCVPIQVKESFETARNLQLYGWFVYRFGLVAAKQSLAALELALRMFATAKGCSQISGLRNLLQKAHKESWLNLDEYGASGDNEKFITSLCNLRNDFAHGSTMLMEPSAFISFLKTTSELINDLYRDPSIEIQNVAS
jgi:hypothetical protein